MSKNINNYKPNTDGITFLPLGGCGQFGANFNLYGYDGKWIAIDCGIAFADEHFPGVDIMVPDPKFIEAQAENLEGLIITHAHEDHIGAVARLWPRLKCPIYASPFAIEVLKRKFGEFPPKDGAPEIIEFHGDIKIAPFDIEAIPVAHSIPEAFALAITTETGTVLHSGDWNLDPKPVVGEATSEKRFKALGKKGVLAYIGDSTNAPVDGFSASESEVSPSFEKLFKRCTGKIAVTLFSSNISRVLGVVKAAQGCKRSICIAGRSLANMVENARACGYISDDIKFVSEDEAQSLSKNKVVYIVTGSQGEDRAALAKISRGMHPRIKLGKGDTVFFSARSIPGNERGILDMKNLLLESGLDVIDPQNAGEIIHVSGHPRRGEIQKMLGWVKPKSLIAIHGEHQQQVAHAKMHDNSIVPINGQILLIKSDGTLETKGYTEAGLQAVDFDRIVDFDHAAISERRKMSFNGAVMVSLVYDIIDDDILDLQITTLGLLDMNRPTDKKSFDGLEEAIDRAISKMPKKARTKHDELTNKIRACSKRYFRELFRARPLVEIHITLLD
ncbi:MAG: MBL fold hydrolase [Alphaproteobacteria bacterium]|nr:MAG: MBL fold hydrolase [Alphaproteobacteria bacterium]